jgi:hypothetical protein
MELVHLALVDKLLLLETIHAHLAIPVAIIVQLPMELKYAQAAPLIMATILTEVVQYVQLDNHLPEETPHAPSVVLAAQTVQ